MTQPSPADTLRTAAEKLRELIANTTRAPWHGDDIDEVQSPEGQVARVYKALYPNSRYIAAMHPGVGQALAQWLEAEARYLATAAPGWKREAHPDALAVARAILGEDPS